jgi:hypothetical protein
VNMCLPHYYDLGIDVLIMCDNEDAARLSHHPHVHPYICQNYFPDKLDKGLRFMEQMEWDAVLMMGSDDIIDSRLLDSFISNLENGFEAVGILDCYFYDLNYNISIRWPGYPYYHHRHNEPAGAWRLYSRKAIESVGYSLWDSTHGGMDAHSWEKVKKKNKVNAITMKGNGMAIDLKDNYSMTPVTAFDYLVKVSRQEQDDIIQLVNKYRTCSAVYPRGEGGVYL